MFTVTAKEEIYRGARDFQAHCWATERVCEFERAVAYQLVQRGLEPEAPACEELIEELVLREDVEVYSDVYRDVYGFRPSAHLDRFRVLSRDERRALISELFDGLTV